MIAYLFAIVGLYLPEACKEISLVFFTPGILIASCYRIRVGCLVIGIGIVGILEAIKIIVGIIVRIKTFYRQAKLECVSSIEVHVHGAKPLVDITSHFIFISC